jgi:glycogen synthase
MKILEVIFPVAALVIFGGVAYVVGKASKAVAKRLC